MKILKITLAISLAISNIGLFAEEKVENFFVNGVGIDLIRKITAQISVREYIKSV